MGEGAAEIRAVALVGSHARGTARMDSDIDLVLLATEADRIQGDTTWVTEIDWHAIGTRPQRWRDEEYGAYFRSPFLGNNGPSRRRDSASNLRGVPNST